MSDYNLNDNIEIRELPEETQRELLLSYLTSHKMDYIQDFLKDRGLAYSYRKSHLPDKLTEYLDAGEFELSDLVELLNTIEGWGKQQIYLYNAPGALSAQWRDPGFVRQQLQKAGYLDLLNQSKPLILPVEPTLSTIQFDEENGTIRFIWIERRTWRVRLPDEDRIERATDNDLPNSLIQDQIVWQAYRVRMARGLIVFEWNLNTNDAMMLIQQLPSGRQYKALRDQFEGYLRRFFAIDSFDKVRLSSALPGIETCGETRRQHMTFRSTDNRGKIAVTSPRKEQDVFDDDIVINRARTAVGGDATGLLGNFHWLENGGRPDTEVYTQIYGEDDDDQRVGILAEHTEQNVRYVLSRIRHHCV